MSVARRRLESLLNTLQGVLKGEARRQARMAEQSEAGIFHEPVRFNDVCAQTCSLPKPMVYRDYRIVAQVDGKLELHSLQYTVLQKKK